MIQIERNPVVNNDFMRLVVFNELQPTKTNVMNFLVSSRLKTGGNLLRNDLSEQEIADVKEYRSNSEQVKQFKTVKDLLQDLHE